MKLQIARTKTNKFIIINKGPIFFFDTYYCRCGYTSECVPFSNSKDVAYVFDTFEEAVCIANEQLKLHHDTYAKEMSEIYDRDVESIVLEIK